MQRSGQGRAGEQQRVDLRTGHHPRAAYLRVNPARAIRALRILNDAVKLMEKIKPLRETEGTRRWQANFDGESRPPEALHLIHHDLDYSAAITVAPQADR